LLNGHGFGDDPLDGIGMRPLPEMTEEQAGKVGMHALVSRDELVGESETGHKAALLEPEDGSKGARKEDTLNGCECDESFTKGRTTVRDPFECPVGLALDAWDVLNGVKEILALSSVLDVRVDEE
jgi:hypothetical protein